MVVQGPRRCADTYFGQSKLLHTRHELAHPFAFFEPVFEIAGLVQFFVKPAVFEMGGVGRQFIVRATFRNRHKGGFSRQHARLDRGMAALDASSIQVTRIASNEGTPRKHSFGQCLWCAVVDSTSAIANAFAAL